jgi:hypothetical protein
MATALPPGQVANPALPPEPALPAVPPVPPPAEAPPRPAAPLEPLAPPNAPPADPPEPPAVVVPPELAPATLAPAVLTDPPAELEPPAGAPAEPAVFDAPAPFDEPAAAVSAPPPVPPSVVAPKGESVDEPQANAITLPARLTKAGNDRSERMELRVMTYHDALPRAPRALESNTQCDRRNARNSCSRALRVWAQDPDPPTRDALFSAVKCARTRSAQRQ